MGWFVEWLQRFVRLGLQLAGALIAGILGAFTGRSSGGTATIRRATADEVVDVRHEVLRHGLARSTAIFAGDDASTARHWVAEVGGRVVGVTTVLSAPMPDAPVGAPVPMWQLRGMAVLPELRGTGLGERLLLAAQREVAAPMWCNARVGVVPFYEKHGWRAIGDVFEVPHAGPHRRSG